MTLKSLWLSTYTLRCSIFFFNLIILVHSFSMPGFSPFYSPCSPSYPLNEVSPSGVFLHLEGDAETYDAERMYQATLTSDTPFNYVIITGILPSTVTKRLRGDSQFSEEQQDSKCALIYTFMSPVPTRTISFFYMSPTSGSGCTTLSVMASTWNRVIHPEAPVLVLCESPPRISTTLLNLNQNLGVVLYDDFDSSPLSQRWNADESNIETGQQCGEIGRGNALLFCSSSRSYITSISLDLTSASYLKFTIGSGSCSVRRTEIFIFFRKMESESSDWDLLQTVIYQSETGNSEERLIQLPDDVRSHVEIKFSSSDAEDLFAPPSIPSDISCIAIDDVIIASSVDLPKSFYEDFEQVDPLKWSWISNRPTSACGRDDVIVVDDYLTSRDLDLSAGAVRQVATEDVIFSKSGTVKPEVCGHDSDEVLIFTGSGDRFVCTTEDVDLSVVSAIETTLSIGSRQCPEFYSSSFSQVNLIYRSLDGEEEVIQTFTSSNFQTATDLTLPIPSKYKQLDGVLCFKQVGSKEDYEDIWAMNGLHLVTESLQNHYFAQFLFNLGCETDSSEETRLNFLFSNDLGESWSNVHTECLPEVCDGNPSFYHTTFSSNEYTSWSRVTFPLPAAALSATTRFKWSHNSHESADWILDEVYIGSDDNCPEYCSGHGTCTPEGCRCDDGYSGSACEEPLFQLINFLSEDFSSFQINHTLFSQARGAEIGFHCGIVAFGKALVFNQPGIRLLTTQPIDATHLRFVQFSITMGRSSNSGSCRGPSGAGEGVLVQYSTNAGITWKILQLIPFNYYRDPGVVSLRLPEDAITSGLQVRWYQSARDLKAGEGVWAIDDVTVSSKFFRTAYSESVNFHLGQIQEYCGHFPVLAFTAQPAHGFEFRYAETQSLQISSGYVLQAELVIGCHDHQVQFPSTVVFLEYSTDHGKSWQLVYELAAPGTVTNYVYHQASTFQANEYSVWTRKMVPLPQGTWSQTTRFRLIEKGSNEETDSWSVDNVYIGPGCPDLCHNHGLCSHGICTCEPGYSGASCLPDQPLPLSLDIQFDDARKLIRAGWKIIGGSTTSVTDLDSRGCGPMTGSSYLHFDQPGVRKLVTPDMDILEGRRIQFYIQIGGGTCSRASERSNGVVLQYSLNGGNTWLLLQELYYNEYPKPTFVHLPLPDAVMTSHTRFRWWQPKHGGLNSDQWSIDDVIIGEFMMSDAGISGVQISPLPSVVIREEKQLRGVGGMVTSFLAFSNRGAADEFCAPQKNSLVFNRLDGDRFATTEDFFLTENDVLQFEINVGCSVDFSYESPVVLQYSHDNGNSWDLVRHSCYQRGQHTLDGRILDNVTSHVCTGVARELSESSRYYAGDYDQWTRVTIPISAKVASKLARFRWFQHVPENRDNDPVVWAIDSVYLGPACPDNCHGHGACVDFGSDKGPKCVCDKGYQETKRGSCGSIHLHKSNIWDKFELGLPSEHWKRPLGGAVTSQSPCGVVNEGNSLLFNEIGSRVLQTKTLDTRNSRLIQFFARIGSQSSSDLCQSPVDRNEGVIFQYSTDNGISWHLIKELSHLFYHKSRGVLVTANMPLRAQTASTTFRWWQPLLTEDDERASWAVDNVFIGATNMLSNGFYDDFESFESETQNLNDENWYKLKGGQVVVAIDECSWDGQKKIKGQSVILGSDDDLSFVETWDFYLLSGTFLQFDLKASCIYNDQDMLRLEYSTDMGKSFQLVTEPCLTDTIDICDYTLGSTYHPGQNKKWTRHTVYLKFSLKTVRFRWIRYSNSNSSSWALDNLYLGRDCEWMCSGHGYCSPHPSSPEVATCKCDEGFSQAPHCQPSAPLPAGIKETFNGDSVPDTFASHIGVSISSNLLVEGQSLSFSGPGLHMARTVSLNTTDTKYVQFYSRFHTTSGFTSSERLLVQWSINNGIKWTTLHQIAMINQDRTELVHLEIPTSARYQATIFRLWMLVDSDHDSATWTVDNFLIGGSVSDCPIRQVEDHFDHVTSNWLFHPGGVISESCESNVDQDPYSLEDLPELDANSAMVFSRSFGERSLISADMCLCEDSVIQFKISVGCLGDGSSPSFSNAIRLEASDDFGATWQLVQPTCHGDSNVLDTRCGRERRESSIYYPGSFDPPRFVTIPLINKKQICIQESNQVRFRWTQGFYDDGTKAIPWSVDDVYIGPSCPDLCHGHGHCVLNSTDDRAVCVCDPGYVGDSCDQFFLNPNPTFFFETFDSDSDYSASHHWNQMSGGSIQGFTSKCSGDEVFFQKYFKMDQPGHRSLVTIDIDTSTLTYVQFYLQQDSCTLDTLTHECQVTEEPIYLQYSINGGIEWFTIETFPFARTLESVRVNYIMIQLPEHARGPATRFRWWQPSNNGRYDLNWAIDQIVVGHGLRGIDDDFSRDQPDTWIEMSGSGIDRTSGRLCGAHEGYLSLGGMFFCKEREAVTNGVNTGPGSFIHFNLFSDCSSSEDTCLPILLEYSLDSGHTWKLVISDCKIEDPDCESSTRGSFYFSDAYKSGTMNRVIHLLPASTHSSSTRFRWSLPAGSLSNSWAIDDVYVGHDCPAACFGHGNCHNGACQCDDGWKGSSCQEPIEKLPTEIKENFVLEAGDSFINVVGADIDSVCGTVGFGSALHFYKGCSRLLITKPIDTSEADFVQFLFRFGCYGNRPTSRDQGVIVEYTWTGGAAWKQLAEIYYADHTDEPGFINIFLPSAAKRVGVQFRWRQLTHDGEKQQDWAIDDLLISGGRKGKYLSDLFIMDDPEPGFEVAHLGLYLDRGDKDMWRFYDNTKPTNFCGRDNVILAGITPNIDAYVGTKDFVATSDYILQYSIVVLCEDVQINHQPVHVQASTDFGDTWSYVVPQCLPSDGDCFGKEIVQPSAHFVSPDWRRRTIFLPERFTERPVRFRFIQFNSDVVWALDHFYVGPACPDACSGHGNCVREGSTPECVCDQGFTGPNCYLDHQIRTYTKCTFNLDEPIIGISLLEAEKFGSNCGPLSDGDSMYFDGVGPRQIVTSPLNLQDSRFVRYHVVIGAEESAGTCLNTKRRTDGLLLQYSTNGGITWKMLHELDYQLYRIGRVDYVELPLDARINSTLVRLWQAIEIDFKSGLALMGADRAGWAIDDLYIGGDEVNEAEMLTSFNQEDLPISNIGDVPDEMFDFHPKGLVADDVCGQVGSALWWPNEEPSVVDQSVTTRQLIVSKDYVIQFKIKVGCGGITDQCDQSFGVYLEYREDPSREDWRLVRRKCFPAAPPNSECVPFENFQDSIFSMNRESKWIRKTIILNHIESSTTQFRWRQDGLATMKYSWAVDDIYIGESCPDHCSGHGDCLLGRQCKCDEGFYGSSCELEVADTRQITFKENFEAPSEREIALLKSMKGSDASFPKRWSRIDGGVIGLGGCGSLRPYGYGRTAYFNGCGERALTTIEMDLTRAGYIQYVIQIGSTSPSSGCRVFQGSAGNSNASVLLQFSTNNGITWNLLREHRPRYFGSARRLSVVITEEVKSPQTIIRWVQPYHHAAGYDQWAVDNVEVVMTRQNMYLQNKEVSSRRNVERKRRKPHVKKTKTVA